MTDPFKMLGIDRDDPKVRKIVDDIDAHWKQRPCPNNCGCTEMYDDRKPDKPNGGFGPAGCDCQRCND